MPDRSFSSLNTLLLNKIMATVWHILTPMRVLPWPKPEIPAWWTMEDDYEDDKLIL